jgi:hypothetical protein
MEPGLTDLKYRQLLNEEEYLDAQDRFGEDSFRAGIGAEAIREMLAAIDLDADIDESGWKQVHGDVFRTPAQPMLFAALVGTGAQLSAMSLLAILTATLLNRSVPWRVVEADVQFVDRPWVFSEPERGSRAVDCPAGWYGEIYAGGRCGGGRKYRDGVSPLARFPPEGCAAKRAGR